MNDRRFDAIVIGTGMGGATLGHALVRAGWRVLFCERGSGNFAGSDALRGRYAEAYRARGGADEAAWCAILREAGRDFDSMTDRSTAKAREFVPFLGAGGGGSTALYGMALERFFPADFAPREHHRDAGDSTIPAHWPISYAELEPFYAEAERLYGVNGGGDPLRAASPGTAAPLEAAALSPAARELATFFEGKGLHPYRLPLACRRIPGCAGCQGYLCARSCKIDSVAACLRPALDLGADLIDRCEAVRIVATRDRVSGVVCRHEGRELQVRAEIVVLAAGALRSPALLLASASADWPQGLANRSGLVGRNLMRHYVDLYAVFPKTLPAQVDNAKEIAWNDLYVTERGKFGTFQSFGAMIPADVLVDGLVQDMRDADRRRSAALLRLGKPVIACALAMMFSRTRVFATILEDLPYADNRVGIGDGAGVSIRYRIGEREAARIAQFRARVRSLLAPYRFIQIRQAENNQRLAHACGTCRFGSDPRASVLDPMNRAHGLANLYVVDASFFPSSGGTNPALTIAANALRVAAHLAASG